MAEGWPTANIALVISGCSFLLALASFVWNIWSKFIYPKPKLTVNIAFTVPVGSVSDAPSAISLTAVNHGPGELILNAPIGKLRESRAMLSVYSNYPYSLNMTPPGHAPDLPRKLSVGESATIYLPKNKDGFRSLLSLGFIDGYGREHFASRRSTSSFQNFLRGKR